MKNILNVMLKKPYIIILVIWGIFIQNSIRRELLFEVPHKFGELIGLAISIVLIWLVFNKILKVHKGNPNHKGFPFFFLNFNPKV